MQFTHGRIALLAIVSGFEMVYLYDGILVNLGAQLPRIKILPVQRPAALQPVLSFLV